MHRMAQEICAGECVLGLNSECLDGDSPAFGGMGADADIYVVHTHLPDLIDQRTAKIIWVAHGTPETMFQSSVIEGGKNQHGVPDAWMMTHHWLQRADIIVTFWPRHQEIWKSLCSKNSQIACVPMGVDKIKWQSIPSKGKFAGTPSLLTAENCHFIKWPLDLFFALSWVVEEIRDLRLHVFHMPLDQARWWYPLLFNNGVAYRSFISPFSYEEEGLKNAFASVDYYIGLVRYGDFNRICLEAKAVGCPVISYRGNEYADYWIDEGDQRVIAAQIKMILEGKVPKRECPALRGVPDISETVQGMVEIYKRFE